MSSSSIEADGRGHSILACPVQVRSTDRWEADTSRRSVATDTDDHRPMEEGIQAAWLTAWDLA